MYITTLGILAVIGQIGAVVLAIHLVFKPKFLSWIDSMFGAHALTLAFFTVLFSVTGSLIFSNVYDFAPCYLCWWSRVLMFPLLPLMAVALIKKEKEFFWYPIVPVALGIALSIYHVFFERVGDPLAPCDASGISCAAKPVWIFGYIGIPMMALTSYVIIALLLFLHRRFVRTQNADNI